MVLRSAPLINGTTSFLICPPKYFLPIFSVSEKEREKIKRRKKKRKTGSQRVGSSFYNFELITKTTLDIPGAGVAPSQHQHLVVIQVPLEW